MAAQVPNTCAARSPTHTSSSHVPNLTLDSSPQMHCPLYYLGPLLCPMEPSLMSFSLSHPRPVGQPTPWAGLPNISRTQPLNVPLAAASTSTPSVASSSGLHMVPALSPTYLCSRYLQTRVAATVLPGPSPQPPAHSLHSSHTGLPTSFHCCPEYSVPCPWATSSLP